MSLSEQVSAKVVSFLLHQIGVSEFHDWFIPATWDIDREPEQFKRFAYRVQLILAEFSNGDRNEQEVREEILSLLNLKTKTLTVMVTVGTPPPVSAGQPKDSLKETQVGQPTVGTLSAMAPV